VVRVVAFFAAGVAALAAPGLARSYGWPIMPLDQPHAIRGAFDDPRDGRSFHFGVDIAAPDGTPVYAVEPGTVFRYSDAVAVRQADGHEFSYWHVQATVDEHAYVTAGEQIGAVRAGWGHVHFAEFDGRTYVNPLRPGALEPFTDTTTPVVGPIDVDRTGGRIDATVEAYDLPPVSPPPPWQDARWTPERIRWRLYHDGRELVPWVDAADFDTLLPPARFQAVYAPGTEQNSPGRPGRYVFWLARGLELQNGPYELEVEAADTRGNTGYGAVSFDVTDARPQSRNTTNRASR
jgi:Peptidase family M23